MNFYKNITLEYNDELWRSNRLKLVIDFLDETPTITNKEHILSKIIKLEDEKGILKVYCSENLTDYERLWIKWIWADNDEHIVKFYKKSFCPHCTKPPQIEDQEVKDYFKYLDFNNNI